MPPIHRKLDPISGGRYIVLREKQGTAAPDGFTTPTDALIYALVDGDGNIPDGVQAATQTVQIGDADGNEKIKTYWTGDTPGGSIDLSLWLRTDSGTWVQQGTTASGLTANTFAEFSVHGASQFFFLVRGAPTGTNLRVHGMGYRD